MRRLLRITLKTLKWTGVALSTLLLIGTVSFWARSLGHDEQWTWCHRGPRSDNRADAHADQNAQWTRFVRLIDGHLWLSMSYQTPRYQIDTFPSHWRLPRTAAEARAVLDGEFSPRTGLFGDGPTDRRRFWRLGDLRLHRYSYDSRLNGTSTDDEVFELTSVAIPVWLFAVVFSLWPAYFAARRLLGRRRYGAGLCPQCGYDLRATPDRCPECGAISVRKSP